VKREFRRAAMDAPFHRPGRRALLGLGQMGTSMSEEQPRRRFGAGFAWGCLTPILIVGLVVIAAVAYGGYYLIAGFKNDPSLQAVLSAVQKNPIARGVLGDPIELAGMPAYSFNYNTSGHTASYAFNVHGSKADGQVKAGVVIDGGRTTIKALQLTGPDGQTYDLMKTAPSDAVWLLKQNFAWLAPRGPVPQPS